MPRPARLVHASRRVDRLTVALLHVGRPPLSIVSPSTLLRQQNIEMRATLSLALLAAIGGTIAQHDHLDIPEVDHFVSSMLSEFHQYAAAPLVYRRSPH